MVLNNCLVVHVISDSANINKTVFFQHLLPRLVRLYHIGRYLSQTPCSKCLLVVFWTGRITFPSGEKPTDFMGIDTYSFSDAKTTFTLLPPCPTICLRMTNQLLSYAKTTFTLLLPCPPICLRMTNQLLLWTLINNEITTMLPISRQHGSEGLGRHR